MDPNDVQSTIRTYSHEVDNRLPPGHEAHDLGQALTKQMDSEIPVPSKHALIRRFFEQDAPECESDPLTGLVREESARLAKTLLDFDQKIPEKDRLNGSQFEPTIEGVIKVTRQTFARWEEKKKKGIAGTMQLLFHRFCRGISSHSSMLKILPEGNEYISLFTGVLSIIISASATHERVVEGFVENLCSINEFVENIRVDKFLYNTDAMIKAVSELYSLVFSYLSRVMGWIMKKRRTRLIASFNESLPERFESVIKQISSSADKIRNIAQQSSRAEVRYHRQESENAHWDMMIRFHGVEERQAEMMHKLEAIEEYRRQESRYQRKLGHDVKSFLEENFRRERMTQYSLKPVSPNQLEVFAQSGLQLEKLNQMTELASSDEIALNSRHLEDFFSRDRVRLHANDSAPMPFEPEFISRITDWSKAQAVPMLRIDGPVMDCDEEQNPVTMLAAQLIDLIARSRLHVISYFCELSRSVKAADRELQATVALVYSLIRQLIELLPPEFEASADLSEARFRRLDGTFESCGEATQMFKDLLDAVPAATVYCVIDGLHLMDIKRAEESLRVFLRQIRGADGKLRVLFTTSGRSACLSRELKVEETLVIDTFRKGVESPGLGI